MDQPEPQIERRLVLRGVVAGGAVLAAGSALTACGSEDPAASDTSPTPTSPQPDENGNGNGNSSGEVLVAAKEVPVGGGIILENPDVVVTQPTAGEFVAFSSICTHAGCPVADVTNGTINCTVCHGSKFSIEDGSVVAGPAPAPLPPIAVTLDGKSVVRA